jgi:glycogen(starch) synthase
MKKESVPKADHLFEVSWEVCNKVGGIYTVLKSKAITQHQLYGDKYCLIGPYVEKEAKIRFERENPPKELKKAFSELKKDKIQCYYGKWPVGTKRIKTILIDFSAYMPKAQDITALLTLHGSQKKGIIHLLSGLQRLVCCCRN